MMKSRIFASLLLAGFPWLVMAQSNDDLYFVPKKKTEAKKEAAAPVERTVAVGTVVEHNCVCGRDLQL